jgi:hypothetical protein
MISSPASTVGLLLPLLSVVNAHGRLMEPSATFLDPYGDPTTFCATIDGPSTWPGYSFTTDPESNTKSFTKAFADKGYSSLKAWLDSWNSGGECGITKFGPPQALPTDKILKWANGQEGFVSSHEGPCEVWCDNTRVFHDANCARNHPNGYMKLDDRHQAICQGSQKLIVLWLALHSPSWQVYKNCVTLGGTGSPSTPTSPSITEKPVTTKPEYEVGVEPSQPPKPSQPSQPSTSNGKKVIGWGQCGGKSYNGPTECVRGYTCQSLLEWYSQCLPNAPKKDELATWAQCGGRGYQGKTQCKEGDCCARRDEWYSQCLPEER